MSLLSSALAGGFFTTNVTWEAHRDRQQLPNPELLEHSTEKAAQTVQDIAHDNYQVKENFVSFKVRKPSFIGRTRTVFNKADIISPAEMAAVFLSMSLLQ